METLLHYEQSFNKWSRQGSEKDDQDLARQLLTTYHDVSFPSNPSQLLT